MLKNKPSPPPPETLEDATAENTPLFGFRGVRTRAKCVSLYDGDTGHFVFSMPGYGVGGASLVRMRCRLAGYNSAEMRGKTPEEKAAAKAARDYLAAAILGKVVDVEFGDFDLYGRPLTTVWIPGKEGAGQPTTAAEYMISSGHGAAYSGRGEKAWA